MKLNTGDILTPAAHAFFFLFLSSIAIFTIYLAALGWPVFMDNLTAKWMGIDNVQELRMVMEFNADVTPLPMRKP